MKTKAQTKTQLKKEITAQVAVSVSVPAQHVQQATAFKLGFYHGHEKLPARKADSFVHKPTATAYAVGYLAGCAARAAQA